MLSDQTTSKVRARATADLRPYDWDSDAARAIATDAVDALNDVLDASLALDIERDPLAMFTMAEDIAYGAPGIAHAVLPTLQAAMIIRRCGSPEQKDRLLPLLTAKGGNAACLLLLESSGRGPSEWESIARQASDSWVLDGRKTAVNDNGGCVFVAVTKTDDGMVQPFAMPNRPAGLSLRNDHGAPTLGLGASRLCTMQLDDVRLPLDSRLGSDSIVAARSVALCRLLVGSVAVGAASASLDYAREWVKQRTAFGKPLAAFEGVAFDIADVDTRVQAARLHLRQVAHDVDRMDNLYAIDALVARSLARTTSLCASAAIDGVQLMGVHGIIHEHPQELFHRISSSLSVLDVDAAHSDFELV